MATKPLDKPTVASLDVNLTNTGQPNKAVPRPEIQTTGYDRGMKPPVEEYNWLWDNNKDWIDYFEGRTEAATDVLAGVVELATSAETITGTDTTRAVTPKGLADTYTAADVLAKLVTVDGTTSGLDADLLDGQHGSFYTVAAATETVSGKVELATQAEVDAGVDTTTVITPSGLSNWSGNRFTHIDAVSLYSSTASTDLNIDLRAYIPNGGEVILSFDFRLQGTTTSLSWAGVSPSNAIPAWSESLHAEMTAQALDSGSQTWSSAGNLFKSSSTGQFQLHKTGGANLLRLRLIGYRAW